MWMTVSSLAGDFVPSAEHQLWLQRRQFHFGRQNIMSWFVSCIISYNLWHYTTHNISDGTIIADSSVSCQMARVGELIIGQSTVGRSQFTA